MRKKLKKKINYEKKIKTFLKREKKFTDWKITAWLFTFNPMLNMDSPFSWVRSGRGKRLWRVMQDEKNNSRSTTDK